MLMVTDSLDYILASKGLKLESFEFKIRGMRIWEVAGVKCSECSCMWVCSSSFNISIFKDDAC